MKLFNTLIFATFALILIIISITDIGSDIVIPKSNNNKFDFEENHLKRIEKKKKEIDKFIQARTGNYNIPSAAVIVIYKNRVLYQNEKNSNLKELYKIASFTKIFTSIAVLQLADKGKLSLDDKISKHLNIELENKKISSSPITIRQLLVHTSGFKDSGKPQRTSLPMRIPVQRFPSGEYFLYSNTGYNILGYLVSKITGDPLGKYIRENILFPMEMFNCLAPDDITGSAGMECSVNDLGNYITMVLKRGKFKQKRIISEKIYYEIFKSTIVISDSENKSYRGISWRIWTAKGMPYSMYHGARWFRTGGWMQLFPSFNLGYVFLSDPPNHKNKTFTKYYSSLKYHLLHLTEIVGKNKLSPIKFKPTLPDKSNLQLFTGTYKDPIKDTIVIVTEHKNKYLLGRNLKTSETYRLIPTTKQTFVYYPPNDVARPFDFVWGDNETSALVVKGRFYKKL